MKHPKHAPRKPWWLIALLAVGLVAAVLLLQRSPSPAPISAEAQATPTSPFSRERAAADLAKLVGFGPRPAGSDAIAKTRDYIVAELKKAGLEATLDSFEPLTPRGRRKMVNIRASRKGTGTTGDLIVLCGHYDTKVFDFNFVGASDGASSAAWVLEMARATSGLKLSSTLEFLFFDGEEAVVDWTDTDSLYGSRYDVDRRIRSKELDRVKALILVDMIGDKNLNIKREVKSTGWINDIIWKTAQKLGYRREFPEEDQEVEDDHIPYLRARVNAVDLIDFDYPHWHTKEDTLDKIDAKSLKIVGDVVYNSLPEIDKAIPR